MRNANYLLVKHMDIIQTKVGIDPILFTNKAWHQAKQSLIFLHRYEHTWHYPYHDHMVAMVTHENDVTPKCPFILQILAQISVK